MPNPTITKVVEEMSGLPDALQQQVLKFVEALKQQHLELAGDAWDVLESLTGTVEVPSDWSVQHDHYPYSIPRHFLQAGFQPLMTKA